MPRKHSNSGWKVLCFVAVCLFSLSAVQPAEWESRIKDGPPNRFSGTTSVSQDGRTISIQFSNPNLKGKKVNVIVWDDEKDEIIEIQLDANGNGKTDWTPPSDWDSATLTHPSSTDHGIFIL